MSASIPFPRIRQLPASGPNRSVLIGHSEPSPVTCALSVRRSTTALSRVKVGFCVPVGGAYAQVNEFRLEMN